MKDRSPNFLSAKIEMFCDKRRRGREAWENNAFDIYIYIFVYVCIFLYQLNSWVSIKRKRSLFSFGEDRGVDRVSWPLPVHSSPINTLGIYLCRTVSHKYALQYRRDHRVLQHRVLHRETVNQFFISAVLTRTR